MRRSPAEISLGAVLVDGEFDDSHGVLGAVLTVDLEGVDIDVGGVVGFFQVVDLDLRGLLERLSCLTAFPTVS